ncbi:hypothetical protein GALMADRAFT_256309 [Galerina marginata CBS 339.88]|uniref:Uncharacterized protein n=1 Tax=Galerina marginata (strain CBS 339.88) TaxID=685588 RepID=A0A067SDT2_GALM3|nr:hypothetical protein GALMADRAFT_256309 [Galerina marginata CBS 339.88]
MPGSASGPVSAAIVARETSMVTALAAVECSEGLFRSKLELLIMGIRQMYENFMRKWFEP